VTDRFEVTEVALGGGMKGLEGLDESKDSCARSLSLGGPVPDPPCGRSPEGKPPGWSWAPTRSSGPSISLVSFFGFHPYFSFSYRSLFDFGLSLCLVDLLSQSSNQHQSQWAGCVAMEPVEMLMEDLCMYIRKVIVEHVPFIILTTHIITNISIGKYTK